MASTSTPSATPSPCSSSCSHSHPRKSARRSSSSTASPMRPSSTDKYYGHRTTAHLCAAFIQRLFDCPPTLLDAAGAGGAKPALAEFVAYCLHRTRLPEQVTWSALLLLHRLKKRFPQARGSSGHRLFISALMISSKVVCDDTYSNKSWVIVGQNLFPLAEINQMEREMFTYVDYHVSCAQPELDKFMARVRSSLTSPSPRAPKSPSPPSLSKLSCSPPAVRTAHGLPTPAHSPHASPFKRPAPPASPPSPADEETYPSPALSTADSSPGSSPQLQTPPAWAPIFHCHSHTRVKPQALG